MERLSDYDYDLPEGLIAQEPLPERSDSRLLRLGRSTGRAENLRFRDVVQILEPGDLLVLNDTRVTALRVFGAKPTGGKVELLLLSEESPGSYRALVKPGRRLKPGSEVLIDKDVAASVDEDLGEGLRRITFSNPEWLAARLSAIGKIPLPPYVRHEISDPERYQTVFAQVAGSSAAPTAGLHFTHYLLNELRSKGVQTAFVTLDVGLDTFRPVQAEIVAQHRMHGERCALPSETVEAIARCSGRIIAVGTTAVRTLETFATGPRKVEQGEAVSKIFIRPGFRFQVVDGMFTNFHMPRTTMLMLVSALAGRENILAAYREAVGQNYRFLSFGDSMLIL